MASIAVVTDSSCDLAAKRALDANIEIVALDVRLGEIGPEQTAQLSLEEFWQLSATAEALPETSAPSPGAFRDVFLKAKAQGHDGVVCVTISSDLSATYQVACAAAQLVLDEIRVEVIDSRTVTMGQGLIALEAARLAKAGEDLGAVATGARATIDKIRVIGALDTLENLRRGGRIGSAQAFFGSLLSVKPIVEVRDGVVVGESRQRTRVRSLRYLADQLAGLGPLSELALVHAAASKADLDQLVGFIEHLAPGGHIEIGYIGPVVGAHTGVGTIGLCARLA